jgi:hypothetical protein
MQNKEELILDAISKLNSKVDAISAVMNCSSNEDRLDSKTIAILTASVYAVFGRRTAIHSVKLLK